MSVSVGAPQSLTDEELDRQLHERASNRLARRIREAGIEGVMWLALVPLWTKELARACEFPTRQDSLEEFVERTEGMGLCTSARSPPPGAADQVELRVLAAAAPYLTPELRERSLDLAARTTGSSRARAIAGLAAGLDESALSGAITLAREIEPPGARAAALTALAPRLSSPAREALAQEAIDSAYAIEDAGERAHALLACCGAPDPQSVLPLAQHALDAASSIPGAAERDAVLSAVLPLLAQRLTCVSGLSAGSALELLERAAASARVLPEGQDRDRALFGLVEAFSGFDALPAADELAAQIEGQEARALSRAVLACAAVRAGDPRRARELIQVARANIAAGSSPYRELTLLTGIAGLVLATGEQALSPGLVQECVRLADGLIPATEALFPLAAVAALLEQAGDREGAVTQAQHALDIARGIVRARQRCECFAMLLPLSSLPADNREEVVQACLEAAGALADPLDRAAVLPALLPHLDSRGRAALVVQSLELAARPSDELQFWMPEPARQTVIGHISETVPSDIGPTVSHLGRLLLASGQSDVAIPGPVLRWATLAQHAAPSMSATVSEFNRQISRALEARDLGGALDWIDAATLLAGAVGDKLEGAVRYARRQMELVYRSIDDERHLESFLGREEQVAAFRDLLKEEPERDSEERDGDSEEREREWALHFIGAGGVGKTTLLRHIARIAAQEGIVTSRVDFDYLSPDYPVRRPAQLLLELMADLQNYADASQGETMVMRFRDSVVKLHESAQLNPACDDPLEYINGPEFKPVLRSFRDFLLLIDRPIVLILDTCEELAKLHAKGERLPSVEATFAVIEQVAYAVKRVRVVFSGRRLLAGSGAGWKAKAEGTETGALLPAHRSYLRLHQVRGFSETEAREFITKIMKLEVTTDVQDAILRESPDPGAVADIVWSSPPPPETGRRYSPFDVAVLAEWVGEVWPIKPDQISSATMDLYVDRRIVGRIASDDVRRLIPAAVLLRRFDEGLLRSVFSDGSPAFPAAFTELVSQEWVHARFDSELQTSFFVVDPNLYSRLRRYSERPERRAELAGTAEALGPMIEHRIGSSPFGDLSRELVNSAMELLPPDRATALWQRIALRVVEDGRWDWISQVGAVLLGADGAVTVAHPGRAAVRATLASALLHTRGSNIEAQWQEVEQYAPAEPDDFMRWWLTARARAGTVAAAPQSGARALAPFLEVLRSFFSIRPGADRSEHARLLGELAASCCGAVEALVEASEVAGVPVPETAAVVEWLDAVPEAGLPAPVALFAQMLAARSLALDGRWLEAAARRDNAMRSTELIGEDDDHQWFDWLAPSSIVDRTRLEALRLNRFAFMPPMGNEPSFDYGQWRAQAGKRPGSIDAERLLSALLTRELARTVPQLPDLEWFARHDVYDARRQPACIAHSEVRPLFASVALGWLAVGRPARAVDGLRSRIKEATRTGWDPATVSDAQLTQTQIARRMRLSDPELVRHPQYAGGPAEQRESLATIALTRAPSELASLAPIAGATAWSYQTALVPDWRERLGERPRAESPEDELDALEWRLLNGKPEPDPSFSFSVAKWLSLHPSEGERALRLALRAAALGVLEDRLELSEKPAAMRAAALVPHIGVRRVAELAMEEGELLALRLPGRAVALLQLAGNAFQASDDAFGTLGASILATLACAHAGDDDARKGRRDELLQDLRRAAEKGLLRGVPGVEDLLSPEPPGGPRRRRAGPAAQASPTTHGPEAGAAWVGWLGRLDVALTWCGVRRQPSVSNHPGPVPVELDLDATATAPTDRRSRWRSIGLVVLTIIGFVVVVVAVYAGFAVVIHAVLKAFSVNVGFLASFLIGLGAASLVPVAGQAAGVFGNAMRSLGVARTTAGLTVAEAEHPHDPGVLPWPLPRRTSLTLECRRLRASSRARVPLFGALGVQLSLLRALLTQRPGEGLQDRTVTTWGVMWQTPPCGPYRSGAETFPEPLLEPARELIKRLRTSVIALGADIPLPLTGLPWEAFVLEPVQPSCKERRKVELYRRCPSGLAEPVPPLVRRGVVAVVTTPAWKRMAKDGWRNWSRKTLVTEQLDPRQSDGLAVLHLIGRPVSGTRGFLFQVGTAGGLGESVEASVRASGQVLAAPEIRSSPGALIILQAEPFELLARYDTDREEAAKLRLLAREVLDGGASAVLAIPALPPDLAGHVIGIVAGGISMSRFFVQSFESVARATEHRVRSTLRLLDEAGPAAPDPSIQPLLRALPSARSRIAAYDGPHGARDTYVEIADDLCLFVRESSSLIRPTTAP